GRRRVPQCGLSRCLCAGVSLESAAAHAVLLRQRAHGAERHAADPGYFDSSAGRDVVAAEFFADRLRRPYLGADRPLRSALPCMARIRHAGVVAPVGAVLDRVSAPVVYIPSLSTPARSAANVSSAAF